MKKRIAKAINDVKRSVDTNTGCGICWHVVILLSESDAKAFTNLMYFAESTWEHFSGNYSYPVEGAGHLYVLAGKWEGRRLELRLDLIRHVLAVLKTVPRLKDLPDYRTYEDTLKD